MAAAASDPPEPPWLDRDAYPFASRYVDLGGHLVHHVDEGSGPVLLMLHGNPTWSFAYREVMKALRSDHRCIALDLPGFGLSQTATGSPLGPEDHARVVEAFVEHLGLSSVTLVVQDWGGPIGLWAAARHPERYAGLVIGNTWAWPVGGDLHFEVFSRLMGGPLGTLLITSLNLFVNVMVPLGHRRRRVTPAEMAHYRRPLDTPARRRASAVLPRAITASHRWLAEVEGGLGSLAHLPALIAWADADFAFREEERRRWEALLPLHHTRVLHGVGHHLESDAPDELVAAIRGWEAGRATA